MDPNECLKRLREAAAKIIDAGGFVDGEETEDFATCFEALDGWLTKGGFLPSAWVYPSTK